VPVGRETRKQAWQALRTASETSDLMRRLLKEKEERVSPPREPNAQTRMELEEGMWAFRVGKRAAGGVESWVRAVRLETGVTAAEMARRMELQPREVFRLEKSEREGRIGLWKLREAAEALGCEVVYALMPLKGTLGELAAREQKAREEARRQRKEAVDGALESLGVREKLRKALQHALRNEGIRLR
jgi:transcriptional regulator with XRE-family HTH domain